MQNDIVLTFGLPCGRGKINDNETAIQSYGKPIQPIKYTEINSFLCIYNIFDHSSDFLSE